MDEIFGGVDLPSGSGRTTDIRTGFVGSVADATTIGRAIETGQESDDEDDRRRGGKRGADR